MSVIKITKGDTVTVRVTIAHDDETFDLTGATLESRMKSTDGVSVDGTEAIVHATDGIVDCSFTEIPGDGLWTFQLRVGIGGETQTVATQLFNATESIL